MGKAAVVKKPVPDALERTDFNLVMTVVEPVLGTVPMNPKVYGEFIESKKPEDQQDEEYKTVESREMRGWTGYHRDDHGHFVFNYWIKGFLKEAGNAMRNQIGITALKSKIDQFVFVRPRRIYWDLTDAEDQELTIKSLMMMNRGDGDKLAVGPGGLVYLERPLRANTPQGPRVTVVRSDVIPAGAMLSVKLQVLNGPISEKALRRILDYGEFKGIGQWRNADYGSFTYELTKV